MCQAGSMPKTPFNGAYTLNYDQVAFVIMTLKDPLPTENLTIETAPEAAGIFDLLKPFLKGEGT